MKGAAKLTFIGGIFLAFLMVTSTAFSQTKKSGANFWGDADGNGAIGGNDISILKTIFVTPGTSDASLYGTIPKTRYIQDLDGNGAIGFNDISILATWYGGNYSDKSGHPATFPLQGATHVTVAAGDSIAFSALLRSSGNSLRPGWGVIFSVGNTSDCNAQVYGYNPAGGSTADAWRSPAAFHYTAAPSDGGMVSVLVRPDLGCQDGDSIYINVYIPDDDESGAAGDRCPSDILADAPGRFTITVQEDNEAPSIPTGLNAISVSQTQIELFWTASTDNVRVAGYNIYSDGEYLKSVEGTTASDTGLAAYTTYCYRVSAYDPVGNESGQSDQACATTFGTTVLGVNDGYTSGFNNWSSIAVDSNNKVHISYQESYNRPAYTWSLSYVTNISGIWQPTVVDFETAKSYGNYNSIALDSNNNVHISYWNGTNEEKSLKYATNAGGSWHTDTPDNADQVGQWTSIAVDSNNNVHISHNDAPNNNLKYATNGGGMWQTFTVDGTTGTCGGSGSVGSYTSIAVDSDNKVHISYFDSGSSDLKYATNKSGSWVCTIVDGSTNRVGQYTSIGLDSNNNVHISYYDIDNTALKYATNESGLWVSTIVDNTANVGLWSSIGLDSNDKVHISYQDGDTNRDLKYATNATGSWVYATLDSYENVGRHTSIAIDSNNKVHISYEYYGPTNDSSLKYATNAP